MLDTISFSVRFRLRAAQPVAHSQLHHPSVRKGPTRFDHDSGLSWRGHRSQFVLTFYDKAREMCIAGSCLRVEVRLCGPWIPRMLHGGPWTGFSALYEAFRQ